jgi:hypothetical protein
MNPKTRPLLLVLLLVVVLGSFPGCATNPFANFLKTGKVDTTQVPTIVNASPAGLVGYDLVNAAELAFNNFATVKAGNADYVWGLLQAINSYSTVIKTQADLQTLIAAWDGTKDQSLANRIAAMFGASTGTIQERMAALAVAAQDTANAHSGP